MKNSNEKFTEDFFNILVAKVDEQCLGEGCYLIEKVSIKYFENVQDDQDTTPLDDTFIKSSQSFPYKKI